MQLQGAMPGKLEGDLNNGQLSTEDGIFEFTDLQKDDGDHHSCH